MFYDRFIKLCDQKGVSRTKACVDCGISRTAWHKWENGATPNGATINKFAIYFDVPVGALLEEKAKKEQPIETDELSSEKQKMYDIIDNLSAEQIRRLIQIACAAFDEQTN